MSIAKPIQCPMGKHRINASTKVLLSILAVLLVEGCTTYNASYHLSKAAEATNCADKIDSYESAITAEYYDKVTSSGKIDKGIQGLKASVPYCGSRQQSVTDDLLAAIRSLNSMQHPQTGSVADLYFDYLARYPYAFTNVSYSIYAVSGLSEDQRRKFLDVAIERGIWNTSDVGEMRAKLHVLGMDSQENRDRLDKLDAVLASIEASSRLATSGEFTLGETYSLLSHGHYTDDTDARAARYLRAYAAGARQQGDEKRARITEMLAQEKDQAYAVSVRQDAEREAKIAQSNATQAAIMGALGTATTIAVGAAAASAYSGGGQSGSAQTGAGCDDIPRSSPENYIRICNCKNGRSTRFMEASGATVVSCKLPSGLNSSCKFFPEGGNPSCGMESR